jgi:PqqD family protein of HPr-rel-A system
MSRLQHLAINNEGFVFDPTTGESFTVNPSGLTILNSLKENKSIDSVIADLKASYDFIPEEIERDVNDFLSQLRSMRLI